MTIEREREREREKEREYGVEMLINGTYYICSSQLIQTSSIYYYSYYNIVETLISIKINSVNRPPEGTISYFYCN